MLSEEVLKHVGIKGMKWGVRRNRNRPGGADGKEESVKVKDKRSGVKKQIDSLKRERQWHKVIKDVDKLTTKDINAVSKRIGLENDLKKYSKTKGVGTKKDKEDYLRRGFMSDAELSRKVVRLRAKNGLRTNVNAASKEQKDLGAKIVRIGGSLGVKYALNRSLGPKDLFGELMSANKNPKQASSDAKTALLNKVNDPIQKNLLKNVLDKIDKPDKT